MRRQICLSEGKEKIMLDKILAYQEVDKKLRDIEIELAKSEERKKTYAAQTFLKSVNDQISALDKRAEELVAKYASLNSAYAKLEEEIKEYDGLEVGDDLDQVVYIKKKAQVLASEIESLAEAIEAVAGDIKGVLKEFSKIKAENKAMKEQYEEYMPKYNALKDSKKDEIDGIRKELAAIEKQIPEDVMEKYKQKRKDRIFPVLNKATELGKSGIYCACGKDLPDAQQRQLKGGEIVECESCHRLLYLPVK